MIFQETSPGVRPSKPVTVRRTLLKSDLLEIFEEPRILEYKLDITLIAQDGRGGEGKGSVVVREVLTSFWNECFSSLTVGKGSKCQA